MKEQMNKFLHEGERGLNRRENHEVLSKRDPITGVIIFEAWYKYDDLDRNLDRAAGPAYINRDARTGVVTREAWYKDGKLDRAAGPAYIERDARTGVVTREAWYKDGTAFVVAPQLALSLG
jgi:hypothetical protein